MSRISPLEPPYESGLQKQFDAIMHMAPPLMLFRVLASQPRAWQKFCASGLLDRGPLSLREREIVINRTCALTGCEYEWGVHVATFAKAAQLTDGEILGTVEGGADAICWSGSDRALVMAAEALHHRSTLTEAEFGALRSHYSDAQIIEIVLLCGFYHTVSYLANSLALPLESNGARFPSECGGPS